MIQTSLGKRVPRWGIPLSLMKFLAKFGDLYKAVFGRRFIFDSDQLQKLIGNSYYSSRKIITELHFTPKNNLSSSMPNIISSIF